ncbi:MAG TPA: 2-oxoacid:ferredoxin oxidoreductase subunit alpha [Candidatus Bathyarchaeia archaeon]|nr:2-oxoacid:ferredoxin oxidoreductase subunit alpha [Candidatus Bathyarchaeia archaeon]
MIKNKLVWMIGGAQGSGVDSSANVFGAACSLGGFYIHGEREYFSNIKGLHSYFQIRVDEKPVRCHRSEVNLLVSFDSETIVKHFLELTPDGGLIYDPTLTDIRLQDIQSMDQRILADMQRYLSDKGRGDKISDIIGDAKDRGIGLFPVPYSELLKRIAQKIGEPKMSKVARMTNIVAVSASVGLLRYDASILHEAIRRAFREKPKIAEMNIVAAEEALDYVDSNFRDAFKYRLESVPKKEKTILLNGTQAVAMGKILGGCRFQTYYPITPASDESEYIESHQILDAPPGNGSVIVLQTEDEIAAITMATGAALTGVRSSTSTSGPGFSLMMEGLGWAGMNEVPVVITLYQRTGPSTGLPTRHEQGDLKFALYGGHGDFPRIVLSSGDLEECFFDAAKAFNYAERYQTPVIHLLDKALANSSDTYHIFDTSKPRIERGEMLSSSELSALVEREGAYKRFRYTESGISPRVALGTEGGAFWNTGDEHDEKGHITENPSIRTEMMDKRMKKLETADREIPDGEKANVYGTPNADLRIISWGSTKGAILEAMEHLSERGIKTSFLQIRMFEPFPRKLVAEYLENAKIKVDVEMNYYGQLNSLLKERVMIDADYLLLKYNGRPMSCDEVYDALVSIWDGKAPRRQVLTHGA